MSKLKVKQNNNVYDHVSMNMVLKKLKEVEGKLMEVLIRQPQPITTQTLF